MSDLDWYIEHGDDYPPLTQGDLIALDMHVIAGRDERESENQLRLVQSIARAAARKAWDEGYDEGAVYEIEAYWGPPMPKPPNPYAGGDDWGSHPETLQAEHRAACEPADLDTVKSIEDYTLDERSGL